MRLKGRLKLKTLVVILDIFIVLLLLVVFDDTFQTQQTPKVSKKRLFGGVQIENATIPSEWTASPEISSKLDKRRQHVREVCHKYGLDIRSANNTPNVYEFFINHRHHLVWCAIYKAASSTWLYNFNLLAGYTENQIMKSRKTPVTMARKKYKRPMIEKVEEILHSGERSYLSFMIARHPLDRLVSAYRNKLESGNIFFRKLGKKISDVYSFMVTEKYPNITQFSSSAKKSVRSKTQLRPTFQQFVQYILDQNAGGKKLDEHWESLNKFCTPCLNDFEVYAKVETLEEDGNYIIFTSGIQDVIKPKLINRSKGAPTKSVTKKYLCELSPPQQKGIADLYRIDMELFQYSSKGYFDCVNL